MFLFLKLNQIRQYITLPSIVVTNRLSIVICVIAAERSVITLVNMSTCKYNWRGLNESAFPAHSYLRLYYVFRDHSVNFTVDLTQGVSIDRFHGTDPIKTSNFKAPALFTSASHRIAANSGVLCPKTLLLTGKSFIGHLWAEMA